MSDLRIALAEPGHNAGIEFNFLPEHFNSDCTYFRQAIRIFCKAGWFWQTGDMKNGYQFIEGLGISDDEILETAIKIARYLKTNIII